MANAKTYSKQEQQTILNEADEAVKKVLAPIMKKYPGAIVGHQLSLSVPSAPLVVSHTGVTRPVTAKDAAVPAPETLS